MIMGLVLIFSTAVLGLHTYITNRFPAIPAAALPEETSEDRPQLLSEELPAGSYELFRAPGQVVLLAVCCLSLCTRSQLPLAHKIHWHCMRAIAHRGAAVWVHFVCSSSADQKFEAVSLLQMQPYFAEHRYRTLKWQR